MLFCHLGLRSEDGKIAREKGRDYYVLEQEWLAFARSGKAPNNPGAAFIGFCQKKSSLR